MNILCGQDALEISKISSVSIETPTEYELGKLEEYYHGDYPRSVDYLSEDLRRLNLEHLTLLHKNLQKSKFCKKLEDTLNKYWYELGFSLEQPKPKSHTHERWTFASKKRSVFSINYISRDGDALVSWKFKKDYGTNASDCRVFGDGETTLSLTEDIMPVLRQLANTELQIKQQLSLKNDIMPALRQFTKSSLEEKTVVQRVYEFFSLLDLNDDSRETPAEMQTELQEICSEYDAAYKKVQQEQADAQARLKQRDEFLTKYANRPVLIVRYAREKKQYLEEYCGFDIFAKKQELEQELALYREKRKAQIASQKTPLIAKITSDFYEQGLLSAARLSNAEKQKAYAELRNFCCKYIPALAAREFRVESLYRDYADFISEESCTAFQENWSRVCRSHSVLLRGAIGEEKVYEVLRLFDDRIRILRDYVWAHEHDFIVITPYGISTIEVKNLRGNYVLTETGVLKCLSSAKVQPKDVALQSKKHLETLRRNLTGCPAFSAAVPLQEIICSAESNFTIQDNYHYIPVCYYNTIDKALFPQNASPVLNKAAMDTIEKYLLANRRNAFQFDVFLPRGEIDSRAAFIQAFADVASGWIVGQEKGGDRLFPSQNGV